MRHIITSAFVLLGVISFGTPALAAVSPVSGDPSWATQYSLYCAPFFPDTPFVEGETYAAEDGPCYFSIPSSITGTPIFGLYEGTVGNAILRTGGGLSGHPTLAQADNVQFFSHPQDKQYFAVVYDFSISPGDVFHAYLTGATTTLPAGAVEGESYYILRWVLKGIPPPPTACADNIDNDGDLLIDYPADPGCTDASGTDETDPPPPATICTDGLDNDGDTFIDYPADPGCADALDNDEYNAPPPPPPPPAPSACLYSLSSNKQNAVQISGSSKIKGTNCNIQINSNANPALDLSGSASVQSTKNCAVGVVKKTGSSSVSPTAVNCGVKADPFLSHATPSVGACTSTNASVAGSQNVTLNPGVYCGGIKVSGAGKVTLNPGVYILKNGPLQIAGSGQVTGNGGVAIFMTGSGAGLDLSGSATLRLVSPASGVLKGFTVFLDPNTPSPLATSQLAGSATIYTEGVVYLPKQQLKLSGSTKNLPSPFSAFLADTVNLAGSTMLTLTLPANTSAIPAGL